MKNTAIIIEDVLGESSDMILDGQEYIEYENVRKIAIEYAKAVIDQMLEFGSMEQTMAGLIYCENDEALYDYERIESFKQMLE